MHKALLSAASHGQLRALAKPAAQYQSRAANLLPTQLLQLWTSTAPRVTCHAHNHHASARHANGYAQGASTAAPVLLPPEDAAASAPLRFASSSALVAGKADLGETMTMDDEDSPLLGAQLSLRTPPHRVDDMDFHSHTLSITQRQAHSAGGPSGHHAADAPSPSSSSTPAGTNQGQAGPLKYQRVLLKISGEALQGSHAGGVDPKVLNLVAEEIAEAHRAGVQLAVVVGGGNYFRGASCPKGMDRAQADYVGMLATVMNALLLQGALESMGVDTRVQTAIEMREVAEPYIRRRAIRHLQERRVVIFGAGTGNPFFTTDTAAALRAAEMNAEVFMKATKVDGVYDCDPMKHRHAKKYDKLSYRQVCHDNLQVMDETAITLCKENSIPVLVFNVMERNNVLRAAQGHQVGTVVSKGDDVRHSA